MVDVVDEQVERLDALLQAALDAAPFRCGDDPRHQIEGEDPLRAGAVAVHVERNPHVEQGPLGRPLPAQELSLRQRVDEVNERFCDRSGLTLFAKHLIEEFTRVVVSESHGSDGS